MGIEKCKNNSMVTLAEIHRCFSDNNMYIPLIQRNYKWPATAPGGRESAVKLLSDLWDSYLKQRNQRYTMGMITLYEEGEGRYQIIDGQQRLITVKLLLKLLEGKERDEYFPLEFQRDQGLKEEKKRSYFLRNIENTALPEYTDQKRFKQNYDAMGKELSELLSGRESVSEIKDEFKEFIFKNVVVLFHITNNEPVDEFLNINKNKTRFSISDYIKAELIIDSGEKNQDRKEILELFGELSKYLFYENTLWDLVSEGYVYKEDHKTPELPRDIQLWYGDENRLKILFTDRYRGNSKLGYEYEKEKSRLLCYKKLLKQLCVQMKNGNRNQYHGFLCYFHVAENRKKYFELFGKNDCTNILTKIFEEVLIDEIKGESDYVKQCFIESQLSGNTDFNAEIKAEMNKKPTLDQWIGIMHHEDWKLFLEYYMQYTEKLKERYDKV